MQSVKYLALAIMASVALVGCAPKMGGNDYNASKGQAQASYYVELGTVTSVRVVKINSDNNIPVGAVGGAVVGGVVGNMFGGGAGRTLATIGGALAGAAGGHMAQKGLTNQDGVEVTVKLDNGKTMAVVQGADMIFSVGQRVKVLTGNSSTRVVPQ